MKLYYLSLLLVGLILSGNGQSEWKNLSPTERATRLTNWMDEKLELSDNQEKNIYAINLKYAEKTESLKKSNTSRREKFQTLKVYDESKDMDLQKYLSDDQYKIYEQKKRDLMRKIRKNKLG